MRGQTLEHAPMRQACGRIVASLEHEFLTVRRAESPSAAVTDGRPGQFAGFGEADIARVFRCYWIARILGIHRCYPV